MKQILIIDDHRILLDSLKEMISNERRDLNIHTLHKPKEALPFLASTHIDLVILDINMPELNGFELCGEINTSFPEVKILAMSMYSNHSIVQQMLKNGASGYILKNTAPSRLLECIDSVLSGKVQIDPAIRFERSSITSPLPELTRREKQILTLIASENTSVEISNALQISIHTVESHRKNLLQKFDVKSSVGLIKLALQHDLI